jgi:formylglycine-generating enzyme required for sulfatase activity
MAVFEVGPHETSSAYSKRIKAVEGLLWLLRDGRREDLELMGVLAWALDDFAARQPSLAAAAAGLRQKVLAPFDPPESPSPEDPEWRLIPGGTFTVSPFHMFEREVTVGEFRRLWPQHSGNPSKPVTGVTWYQAYAYAAWVGGRLPTEAEWEYAARAQCGYDYCDDGRNEIEIHDAAWYDENSSPKLHPPCEKKRNQFGLCDMYGNAWEWVVDWYGEYSAGSVTDPWGPARGVTRVIRGGVFSDSADGTRAAYRDWRLPGAEIRNLGFRVVLPRPAELGHR